MLFLLYFAALSSLTLANYSHYKTANSIGAQPLPGTAAYTAYAWFGGLLSTFGIVCLIGWGFFAFAWWLPLVATLGALFIAGVVFGLAPIGATWVILGFPVGAVLGIILVAIAP